MVNNELLFEIYITRNFVTQIKEDKKNLLQYVKTYVCYILFLLHKISYMTAYNDIHLNIINFSKMFIIPIIMFKVLV